MAQVDLRRGGWLCSECGSWSELEQYPTRCKWCGEPRDAEVVAVIPRVDRPGILTAAADGWPAVIARVLTRDGKCIFYDTGPIIRLGVAPFRPPFDHYCRGKWGEPIPWHRRPRIGELHAAKHVHLDHVPEFTTLSKKAADDEAHLVVACAGAHLGGLATSKEGRDFERRWLAELYPVVWAAWTERRNVAETSDSSHATSL